MNTRKAVCVIIKLTKNGFEMRSESLFLKTGIVLTIMECIGLYFFVPMFFEFDGSIGDLAVGAYICLWLGGILLAAIISFYRDSKKMVINDDGILYSSLFGKKYLDWSAVQDYGLSYDGRSGEGSDISNSYIIYFANEKQKSKNQYRKKLSGEILKVHIRADDYNYFLECAIPFCMSQTDVEPFIPEDKPHFFDLGSCSP